MSPLYTLNGLILRVGNALAAGPNCCCEGGGECCEYKLDEFYTIDYTGPEGNFQISGMGPSLSNAEIDIGFDCTSCFDCDYNFSYALSIYVTIFPQFNQYHLCFPAQQPTPEDGNAGVPCDQQLSLIGLTFNLVNCSNNNTATIVIS